MSDINKFRVRDSQKWLEARKPETTEMAKPQPDGFVTMIERLSARPDIDVSKIEMLLEMQERILSRNARQAFNAAMTRTQSKIELVITKTRNTQTTSLYADLKAVLAMAKPIYTAEGFSLMFYEGETQVPDHKRICVDILHEEGHTEKRWGDFAVQTSGIGGKTMMTQIHGEGSCFSYGRRYLTCAIFNIPTGDDDDGNKAGGPVKFISGKQVEQINKAMQAKGFDDARATKLLAFFNIETIEELPSDQYHILFKMVNAAPKKREPGAEG